MSNGETCSSCGGLIGTEGATMPQGKTLFGLPYCGMCLVGVKQATITEKEREFKAFFNDAVETNVEFIKIHNSIPFQIIYMRKNGTNFVMPVVGIGIPEDVSPLEAVGFVIKKASPDFYVVVSEGWGKTWPEGTTREEIGNIKRGTLGKLPISERLEVLIFTGKSLDGSCQAHRLFHITRIDPADDKSKIIKLEEELDKGQPITSMESSYLP
jgi:vacuolar-type H+-ATPase subunit F/Vma7